MRFFCVCFGPVSCGWRFCRVWGQRWSVFFTTCYKCERFCDARAWGCGGYVLSLQPTERMPSCNLKGRPWFCIAICSRRHSSFLYSNCNGAGFFVREDGGLIFFWYLKIFCTAALGGDGDILFMKGGPALLIMRFLAWYMLFVKLNFICFYHKFESSPWSVRIGGFLRIDSWGGNHEVQLCKAGEESNGPEVFLVASGIARAHGASRLMQRIS